MLTHIRAKKKRLSYMLRYRYKDIGGLESNANHIFCVYLIGLQVVSECIFCKKRLQNDTQNDTCRLL